MKRSEFLVALEDILQRDEPCLENDNLNDYDEWDSLSKMAVMAYYAKFFDIKIALSDLKNMETITDLINLAGDKISD